MNLSQGKPGRKATHLYRVLEGYEPERTPLLYSPVVSPFFVGLPRDVIYLQLCTPKVVV
jgi:hypothetical protein